MEIRIGNSTAGFSAAEVRQAANGKWHIAGEIAGRKGEIKKAVAALNRGQNFITRPNGDEIPFVGR